MIVENDFLEEYPFEGAFYSYSEDENAPLEEQVEAETLVLPTKCDIQAAEKSDVNGNITQSFNVYFPFDKSIGVLVKRGMIFKGSIYGMSVNGRVMNVSPSQLGGCSCSIKDLDV